MFTKLKPYVDGLVHLVYPDLCLSCEKEVRIDDDAFCLSCLCKMPFTNFEKENSNEFTKHFLGRVDIKSGSALFHLVHGSTIEQMLHRLKYQNRPDIGIALGRFYGKVLKNQILFKSIDGIIPIPLHPKKKKIRGYNQSEQFAIGLSEILQIPVFNQAIKRVVFTKTQTKMNRVGRIKNTENAFSLLDAKALTGKQILLVDDVLTTGSTMEACANKINHLKNIKISMLTIAMGV